MTELHTEEQLPEEDSLPEQAPAADQAVIEEALDLNSAKYSLLAGVLILLIVLATVGFGYYYATQVDAQLLTIGELDSQISVIDSQITFEEQKGEKKKQELKKLKEELTSTTTRLLWSEILTELNRVVSEVVSKSNGTVIYNFNSYSLTNNGAVSVNGFTNSYSAIADLIDALEASGKFKEVTFNSSSKSSTEDGQERATLNLTFKLAETEQQTVELNANTPTASTIPDATPDVEAETPPVSDSNPQ